MTKELLQYYTDSFWEKIKALFVSKEDAVNGILLEQGWELVESVNANNTIALPSLDTFEELCVEMYDSNGTVVHNTTLRKDSLLFESTNTEYREILLDSTHDEQTYVVYNMAGNTITPSHYEGVEIDGASTVTTSVYIKGSEVTSTAKSSIITYDGTESGLEADNVQDAIDEHISDKNNPHNVTKSQVGLGNVDNTSDADKPISTAVQTALNGKSNTGHTHNYAGSSSAGGVATSATKVNTNLVVKLNGGATEGTNMFTFNGSTAKTINITPSSIGASASSHTHSYLPLSGGTITSTLTVNGATTLKSTVAITGAVTASSTITATGNVSTKGNFVSTTAYNTNTGVSCTWKDGNNHFLALRSNDGLSSHFGWAGSSSYKTDSYLRGYQVKLACAGNDGSNLAGSMIVFGLIGSNYCINGSSNSATYLGHADYRWKGIYSSANVNVSSDRRLKHNINYDIENEACDLIYNTKPASFIYNDDDSNTKRYGMIAQDVRDYLINNNKEKFGGISVSDINGELDVALDSNEDDVTYSMAYEQYIAPLISVVQSQKKLIDELEKRLSVLENL